MARLMVITNPTIAPGFRLAGVETYAASDATEAQEILKRLMEDEDMGLVAVDEGYLAAFEAAFKRRLEQEEGPVVMAIPSGAAAGPEGARRRQIAELIRRAVGIHITFREQAIE